MRSSTGRYVFIALIAGLGACLYWWLGEKFKGSDGLPQSVTSTPLGDSPEDERIPVSQGPAAIAGEAHGEGSEGRQELSSVEADAIRGQVSRECSGEPIEGLSLLIKMRSGEEREVRTDARGRFLQPAETFEVTVEASPGKVWTFQCDNVEEQQGLRVDIGASYVLLADGSRPWQSDEDELKAYFWGDQVIEAKARKEGDGYAIHLAGEAVSRLPQVVRLTIHNPDGLPRAELEVEASCGKHVVTAVPFSLGSILVKVVDENGAARGGMQAMLFRLRDSQEEFVGVRDVGERGEVAFEDVPIGEYRLRVRHQWHGACEEVVSVVADSTTRHTCHLEKEPGGVFSGTVAWDQGSAKALKGTVVLQGARSYIAELQPILQRDGFSNFVFPHVARGDYRLTAFVREGQGEREVLLDAGVSVPQVGGLWLVDDREGKRLRLVLRVVAGGTRSPVENCRVFLSRKESDESKVSALSVIDGRIEIDDYFDDRISLLVVAEGYQFERVEVPELWRDGTEEVHRDVVLVEGWSVQVTVVNGHGVGEAGCEVLHDGVPVGRTGPDGTLIARGGGEPGVITVSCNGRDVEPMERSLSGLGLLRRVIGLRFTTKRNP